MPLAGSRGGAPGLPGQAVIVAGPTCSGKSALAMALGQRLGGVVINADAMQVYRELRVLTARPTEAEEARLPHALYGVRPVAEPGHVAWWREAALQAMRQAWSQRRLPILCGGTGMYLASLTDGLSAIADPGEAARVEARAMLERLGAPGLHAALAARDPETARTLRPSDGQRLSRAWEVLAGTGRGLASWRREPALPPAPAQFSAVLLLPPRDSLRASIAGRLQAMLRGGALGEVQALLDLGLPASLPAMRAHGVPEFARHLRGEIPLGEATRLAALAQGQYTKRQATWFAHHALAPLERQDIITTRIAGMTQETERIADKIVSFVQTRVDAPVRVRP